MLAAERTVLTANCGAPQGRRRAIEYRPVSHTKPSAYAIPVIDLIHRPGEYRETELDVAAPERLGNAVIAVEKGEEVHVDARL